MVTVSINWLHPATVNMDVNQTLERCCVWTSVWQLSVTEHLIHTNWKYTASL